MMKIHLGVWFSCLVLIAAGSGLDETAIDDASVPGGEEVILIRTLLDFMESSQFDPNEFTSMWGKFYARQYKKVAVHGPKWEKKLDMILKGAVATSLPIVLRTVLEIEYPGIVSKPVFNPNRALFYVSTSTDVEEEQMSKMARLLMEYGATPMLIGVSKDPEYAEMTVVEIAIRHQRPMILEAFLEEPSPISFDTLEAMSINSKDARRGVEVFRTRVVRATLDMVRESNQQRTLVQRGAKAEESPAQKVLRVLVNTNVLIFSERYLRIATWILMYLVFVFLLIFFLFQLRVKRIPNPEILMTPWDDAWWSVLLYSMNTILTSCPQATIFEQIGYGLATVGSILWSQLWTGRRDIALSLLVLIVLQTFFTMSCYTAFAPKISEFNSLGDSIWQDGGPLHKIMYYGRSKDRDRAVNRSLMYLLSCSASFFILLHFLDPRHKMYLCPTLSVSDTYGFDYSLSRTVAVMWDIVIFFSFTLRIFRMIDTVIVFDLPGKLYVSMKAQGTETSLEMTQGSSD
jgi:hypothetical protein